MAAGEAVCRGPNGCNEPILPGERWDVGRRPPAGWEPRAPARSLQQKDRGEAGSRSREDLVMRPRAWSTPKRYPLRWSRIWDEDAPEGTLARHEGRAVVRVRGRWVDAESGEEVHLTRSPRSI